MTRRALLLLVTGIAAFVAGCKTNPIERLMNPYSDASVPGTSGTFVIYDEELKTGGNVAFIPSGENQSIDFADKTAPRRTINQIRYTWTGAATSSTTVGATQQDFAGFSLLSSPSIADNGTTPGRNLALAGYTHLTFWVRASLAAENILRIEGPDDGDPATVPARVEFSSDQVADWRQVSLDVPAGDFEDVRAFMTVSIQYQQPPRTTLPGGGGTVYLDDVRYE